MTARSTFRSTVAAVIATVSLVGAAVVVGAPAGAAEPAFIVYPTGLAKILLTDTADDLVIESGDAGEVHYVLRAADGEVVAAGTLAGVANLEVKTEGGDDQVAVGDGGLRVGLILYTGWGDDVVELQRLTADGGQQARLYTEVGDDTVIADFSGGTPLHFWAFLGDGADTLEVTGAQFDQAALGITYLGTGPGDDTVTTGNNLFGRFRLYTQGGGDTLASAGDTFGGLLRYRGSGGDDTVTLTDAAVMAGATMAMGSGHDTAHLAGGTYSGEVTLDGQVGPADTLVTDPAPIFATPPTIVSFENQLP